MPMPELDQSRFIEAVLADPSHRIPLPDRGFRLFSADGEKIDLAHPFYAALVADGSLVRKPVLDTAHAAIDEPEAREQPDTP